MLHADYGKIKVYYLPHLESGGNTFGQDYLPVVRKLFRKVNHACEFGAGPGFIGFSLLAHGLCKKLTLVEINPEAVKVAKETIKRNRLQGKVSVYLSDGLSKVPAREKWDLVVSNPPHFNGKEKNYLEDLRVYDPSWRIHERFYQGIGKHLNEGGSVLFYENIYGARPSFWEKMIRKNRDLKYIRSFRYRKFGALPKTSDLKKYASKEHGYMQKTPTSKLVLKTMLHASFLLYYPYIFVWSKKK